MKVFICCFTLLLLFLFPPLFAMEGAGVAFKLSLSGKIYKRFSFLLEEDVRPRDDFREAGWFLTTGEINYRILPNLRAGAGCMSLVRYKASEEVRNRYYFYASGSHRFGAFKIAIRERFQSTYKKGCLHPTNYLRSMLTLSCRIASSGFEPFVYIEPFNNTGYKEKMHADKIRYSTGCDYRMNPKNNLQLYYRYHTFNVYDPVNYRHAIGLTYSHRF
ncbi:MAG: DUF2490 domain-containing protein [Parabacteroides sp.]|nr:DUF2490 domain-containing protein [Parabacteroides sp.]